MLTRTSPFWPFLSGVLATACVVMMLGQGSTPSDASQKSFSERIAASKQRVFGDQINVPQPKPSQEDLVAYASDLNDLDKIHADHYVVAANLGRQPIPLAVPENGWVFVMMPDHTARIVRADGSVWAVGNRLQYVIQEKAWGIFPLRFFNFITSKFEAKPARDEDGAGQLTPGESD